LAADVPPELANHARYRVVGVLGKGGMGTVYKAEHRVMKRAVALKVISTHLIADAGAVERFRREVEAAAKLSHPNIVTAFDAEQAGNCHFLVMELVDGLSLDRVLQRQGPLLVALACDYARQAAQGLQHAHEHGMVHRDVKLQNLMVTGKGQVKILDFGLARFASENGSTALTECGALTGTPDFMSPEQAEDAHSADIRADIYSLGCSLYTLLAGQLPFPGGNYVKKIVGHLRKDPAPLTAFRSDLPPDLVQVIGRMMAKDQAQRFQTPGEVARALLAFCKAGATTGGPAPAVGKDEGHVPSGALPQESPPAAADSPAPTDGNTASLPERHPKRRQPSEEIPSRRAARPRAIPRRHRPVWRRGPVVVGVVIGGIGLLCLAGLLIAALLPGGAGDKEKGSVLPAPSGGMGDEGEGQVCVVSRDPHIELAIRRGPKVVGTIGPDTDPQMTLPAGEYQVEVVDGAPEVQGFTGRLSLARGDRKVVEVRLEGIFVRECPGAFPPPPHDPDGPPPRRRGWPPHHRDGPPPRRGWLPHHRDCPPPPHRGGPPHR
jgi:serine/threonine protein kinase